MVDQPSTIMSRVPAWCYFALIVSAGLATYANSFEGEFIYDDQVHICANDRIAHLWPPWEMLRSRRPVVELSLAINYALGGFSVGGYHAFNLGVHLLAALTLFGVIRRTLSLAQLTDRWGAAANGLAGSATLLWVVHPLNTQSVTYVIQRGESMMGLFYLLTLYCVVRGAASTSLGRWHVIAIGCCAMGMGCKGVMVTAPVAVLLFDWVFLSASLGELWRKRGRLHLGLMATWSILFANGLVWGVINPEYVRDRAVGFGIKDFGPLDYLLTQPGVILQYLKLALWPHPLCFDYWWQPPDSAVRVFAPMLVVVPTVLLSFWGVIRKRGAAFLGAWFFLILAPTSSFVPIRDMLVEHRMYLSLAAVILAVVLFIHTMLSRIEQRGVQSSEPRASARADAPKSKRSKTRLKRFGRAGTFLSLLRPASILVAMAAVALGAVTIRRNLDYRTEEAIWRDVVGKRPDNPRGQLNFGNATLDPSEALRAFRRAIKLKLDYSDAYYNLGTHLARSGDLNGAEQAYLSAIEHDDDFALPYFNLGNTLERLDRQDEAIDAYRQAIRLDPTYVRAHYNLGTSLFSRGDVQESIDQFREVLRLVPGRRSPALVAETHFNLATALSRLDRKGEAEQHFRAALALDPNHPGALRALER